MFETLFTKICGKGHPDIPSKVNAAYQHFQIVLEEHFSKSKVYPTKGCLELFEYCKQNNVKIALTTGFYRKIITIILKKLGWNKGLDENF